MKYIWLLIVCLIGWACNQNNTLVKNNSSKTVAKPAKKTKIVPAKKKQEKKQEAKINKNVPELKLSIKTNTSMVYVGKYASFDITISNEGNSFATKVHIKDTIPLGLEYVSSNPPGIYQSGNKYRLASVKWVIAKIAPKEQKKITVELRAMPRGIAYPKNMVQAQYAQVLLEDSQRIGIL